MSEADTKKIKEPQVVGIYVGNNFFCFDRFLIRMLL
jgi:hypothetical protein